MFDTQTQPWPPWANLGPDRCAWGGAPLPQDVTDWSMPSWEQRLTDLEHGQTRGQGFNSAMAEGLRAQNAEIQALKGRLDQVEPYVLWLEAFINSLRALCGGLLRRPAIPGTPGTPSP